VSLAIPVTLLPAGTIRVNIGDYTDTTLSSNLWYGDLNSSHGITPLVGTQYNLTGQTWNTADNTSLLSYIHNGPDAVYPIRVPNGQYSVSFLAGQLASESANQRCTDYEAQGQITSHSYDIIGRGGAGLVGTSIVVPALVSNGLLTVATRYAPCLGAIVSQPAWTIPQYAITYPPLIGSVMITPNSDPAYIGIDNTLDVGVGLLAGKTLQLYPVYGYLASGATWSIVSGPGTINGSGLYTAPGSPTAATVTVRVTSTVDNTKTATTTIPLIQAPNFTTSGKVSFGGKIVIQ
jgi:hypothetical protein